MWIVQRASDACPWSVPEAPKDGDVITKACQCHAGETGILRKRD